MIQAAAIGAPGEVLVLDMGSPCASPMSPSSSSSSPATPVQIVYTGLRDGEKMHEELFGDGEPSDRRPVHPLVSHVPVPALSLDRVASLPAEGDPAAVREAMAALCSVEVAHDSYQGAPVR